MRERLSEERKIQKEGDKIYVKLTDNAVTEENENEILYVKITDVDGKCDKYRDGYKRNKRFCI